MKKLTILSAAIFFLSCPPVETSDLSSNANLSNLTSSLGDLIPNFSSVITEYSVIATASDSNITLTGTVADSTANISSNSGSAEAISLGVNPIEITVTAEDGTVKTYAVRVQVPEYTSANVGNMMYLPAGTYQRDATPTNLSTVSSFSLGATEVTRAQYLSIMGPTLPTQV